MTKKQFEQLYPKYRHVIQAIARKFAKTDDDLCADLEQEGALRLLLIDLHRIRSNQGAFIRTAIRNAMIDYLRRDNPQMYESLDYRLSRGDQLEYSGSELVLLSDQPQRPNLYADGDDESFDLPLINVEEELELGTDESA